jgi:hypothetical protein
MFSPENYEFVWSSMLAQSLLLLLLPLRNVNIRPINYLKLIGEQQQTAGDGEVAEPDAFKAASKSANEPGFNVDRKAINGEYLTSCCICFPSDHVGTWWLRIYE